MDYLEAAKARIAEIEGEHSAQLINCLMLVAIADALVAITEALQSPSQTFGKAKHTCRMEEAYCSECGNPDPSSGDARYCAYCGARVVE